MLIHFAPKWLFYLDSFTEMDDKSCSVDDGVSAKGRHRGGQMVTKRKSHGRGRGAKPLQSYD